MSKKKPKSAAPTSRKKAARRLSTSVAPMFDFAPEELERAVNVFAEFHQDHPMEREMMRIKSYALVAELHKRGLTHALAERLIDDLVQAGVYFKVSQFVNLRTWVPFNGGPQIETSSQEFWYLYSTRSRLRRFFGKCRFSSSHGPLNEFRRKGEFWELTYQWRTVFIGDAVGFAYIAQLLRDPGREVPVVFLQAAQVGVDPLALRGSSGEVIDDEARQRYWKHYGDLQSELESASAGNDIGRAEALQGEITQITNELLRAAGIGGRPRTRSDAERARKSVSQAISRAITRIGSHHESLSRHLLNSITSGQTFCYSPDSPTDWLL